MHRPRLAFQLLVATLVSAGASQLAARAVAQDAAPSKTTAPAPVEPSPAAVSAETNEPRQPGSAAAADAETDTEAGAQAQQFSRAPTVPTPAMSTTPSAAQEVDASVARGLTPPLPAPASTTNAQVKAGETGFSLRSASDPPAFVLKLNATLQADGRVYFDDPQKDNVLLRRVRPILAGTVIGLVDFYLMPDFGGGQATLFDAYLDAHPFPWLRLRAGKFKSPIGLERLQTDSDLPLPERALTSNLSPVRDVGAQLWGEIASGALTYALAVLDGAPDLGNIDQDIGGNKDLAARVFVQPFKQAPELGVLGFGLAATTGGRNGSAKNTSLVALKTIGQTTLFSYLAPATDAMGTSTVFASGRESRLNPQLYYYYGGFGLLSEAIWSRQEVHKGNARTTLTHKAWHATGSYVVAGRNGFTGPVPDNAWSLDEGHWGALEIAARYSWIDLDDRAFPTFADASASATEATGVGGAVTWVLSRMVQLGINLEQTHFKGASKGTSNRKTENLLLSRAQLNF
jgi:phosphate-selective porin OprO/OprP